MPVYKNGDGGAPSLDTFLTVGDGGVAQMASVAAVLRSCARTPYVFNTT